MSEPAIACSLSGGDQIERLREISDLCGRALLDSQETKEGLRLCFAARPGIHEELLRLIDAESQCCSFLRFELSSSGEGLVLEVNGPDQARPLIREMFGFSGESGEAR
jgi:hypothetical protein